VSRVLAPDSSYDFRSLLHPFRIRRTVNFARTHVRLHAQSQQSNFSVLRRPIELRLHAPVAVVNEQALRVEHQVAARRRGDAPADGPTHEDIDDEAHHHLEGGQHPPVETTQMPSEGSRWLGRVRIPSARAPSAVPQPSSNGLAHESQHARPAGPHCRSVSKVQPVCSPIGRIAYHWLP